MNLSHFHFVNAGMVILAVVAFSWGIGNTTSGHIKIKGNEYKRGKTLAVTGISLCVNKQIQILQIQHQI